jgi:hypothetical protein
MIQKEQHRFNLEQKLGIVSIVVIIAIISSVIFSLSFLSKSMMNAFAQETTGTIQTYSFDFKGFEALELK